MRYLKSLIFLFSVLFGVEALAQPSTQTVTRIRSATGATTYADVQQFTLTFPATDFGLQVLSGLYYWDGANMRLSLGETWDNAMTAAPNNINTNAFNVFHSTSTAAGMYWYGETIDDSMTAGPIAPFTASYNVFYDSTNTISRRWLGESLDGSNTAPVVAPYVGAISYGLDATGLVYYPLKTDSSGLYIHVADLLPGEDSTNDWRKVRIQSVNPYSPSATSTASVDNTGTTEILASTEILGYSQYSINVHNTGGANSIDYVVVYVSPDGTNWTILDTYNTDIAAAGIARVVSVINNSDRYIKILAATTAATTSVNTYITGRVSN